jgi:hypothetical protein
VEIHAVTKQVSWRHDLASGGYGRGTRSRSLDGRGADLPLPRPWKGRQ